MAMLYELQTGLLINAVYPEDRNFVAKLIGADNKNGGNSSILDAIQDVIESYQIKLDTTLTGEIPSLEAA